MIRHVDSHLFASSLPPQSQNTTMKPGTHILFLFSVHHLVKTQEISGLSELPFTELLAQKKIAQCGHATEGMPVALALEGEPAEKEIAFKNLHKLSNRKTFYEEDYEDDKGHLYKKKEEHKMHDILNTSIMVLSYLAFGGYLLCMIASAIREKRRRIMMAYPTVGTTTSNQFAQILQHYMAHRPVKPFIKFPTVTVHQGRKKRRKR